MNDEQNPQSEEKDPAQNPGPPDNPETDQDAVEEGQEQIEKVSGN
jgi:hypothetical protein